MFGFDKTFIIAEIGVNHNGNIDNAIRLIDQAVLAGADAVKFQHYKTEKIIQKDLRKESYQVKDKSDSETQYEMLKKYELGRDATIQLIEHASNKNIMFISTPYDTESVDLLVELDISAIKIGSGEITDIQFLGYVASKNIPIILSTGASTLDEVKAAVNCIYKHNRELILLHCTSCYPTAMQDVNLNAMKTLMDEFNCQIGYSDHTLGITISIAAVAMGAKVIERHITLDKNMDGPDHKASLDGEEFKKMITAIRDLEDALGSHVKQPVISEKETINLGRRSIHTTMEIKKGDTFFANMLINKRPGTGISPGKIDEIIGMHAAHDIDVDCILRPQDIEELL